MNELHLFAGAGGGILGGMLLGHTCVCAVEIEHYRRKILIERQRDGILPHFPIWDEIKTFDGRPWKGIVETVCGGFPCQDISARGTGKGIAGEKSGLWSEMRRIIFEILPRYVFVENSPLLIKRGLAIVLGDLASMGYDAKWCCLGASDIGGSHHRKRIWILANANRNGQSRICPQGNGNEHSIEPFLLQHSPPRPRAQSEIPRMVDGRVKALGAGQVPAVVRLAWETLSV
jgi:DNA (cytosine-5)-methyltransferase 1